MGLTYSSVVDASVDEVFAWHARPGAITRLAPPWQPVRVIHESLESLPLSAVLPWRHTHEFSPVGEQATLVTDVVDTPLPARALRSMFVYRHRQLAGDLAALARARMICPDMLTIAVTGSGGLIGTALTALLSTSGHRIIRLVRLPLQHAGERYWRPEDPSPDLLNGVDAVIHLAGASIGGRFTPERKNEIRESRILPTRLLAELAAAAAPQGLRAFVSASAIGLYGPDRGEEILTEASPRGEGFLADVVADWEDATTPAAAAGIRTVRVRTGIVQTPRGGMLRLLSPLFEAGLGGRLGSGKQWLAWIGLDDLLDIYLRAVLDPGLSGPVNAVAPEPVRNIDYTRTLAGVLRAARGAAGPGFGARLLLGDEGAREVAQASRYVRPERLIAAGHTFRQPELEERCGTYSAERKRPGRQSGPRCVAK